MVYLAAWIEAQYSHGIISSLSSLLPEWLDGKQQIGNEQLVLGLLLGWLPLYRISLEPFFEEIVLILALSEDIVALALDLLQLADLVALDRQHLEHFFLFERVAVVLDESLEVLQVLEAHQRVQDLLIDDALPGLDQLVEPRPCELWHFPPDILHNTTAYILQIGLHTLRILPKHLCLLLLPRLLREAAPIVLHKARKGVLKLRTDEYLLKLRDDLVEHHIVC